MKNLLKALLSVAVIAIGVMPALAFPDVSKDYWAASQINLLSEQGVIVGYPDGTFKPDANVTRAEFAAMAIRALGQQHTKIAQPITYADVDENYWAYQDIQKAVYFDLISNSKENDLFRPEDSVSRAESLSVAVNALTTETISPDKAKEVLERRYIDANTIPEWFLIPAGKAEILGMIVVAPSAKKAALEADRPATRAEVTAILNNMMIQAKLNPNAKLAEAMRKKTGEGYVIPTAYVQGSVGTIPEGAVVPINVNRGFSSQTSTKGEQFTGEATQNYITKDKYILIYKGTKFSGELQEVQAGRWFVRNGVIQLGTNIINTPNDQNFMLETVGNVSMKKNKFMTWVRKVFKGEKLILPQGGTVYVKFLKEIKTDLTNGWIYYQ